MAAVCTSECDFRNLVPQKEVQQSSQHQGCHQMSDEEEETSSEDEDCGAKICHLDEIIKAEVVDFSGAISAKIISYQYFDYLIVSLETPAKELSVTESPPDFRPYLTVALFIQKSSYLI